MKICAFLWTYYGYPNSRYEGQNHLEEYADAHTERGQCMLKRICEMLGFDSLGYQSLEGVLESIGIDKDKVCTFCWTGR